MNAIPAENLRVAERLREASHLLSAQGASAYRIDAYRAAADSIAHLARDVRRLYDAEGVRGLDAIPHVGLGIAAAVAEMLATRHWSELERLRGGSGATALFECVPGIGARLARRIHKELGVETLEALENAAHDGRLANVLGVGERRSASIRACLAQMLAGERRARLAQSAPAESPVEMLLDVDSEYRRKSALGELHLIAPCRFNPEGAAWLPILHASRGDWRFTALYSNTAMAHKLARLVYRMLKFGQQYVDNGMEQYDARFRAQRFHWLQRQARALHLQLVPNQPVPSPVS